MLTEDAGMKFFPSIRRLKAGPPTATVAGTTAATCGRGVRTRKVNSLEAPPPGAGLLTFTETSPGISSALKGTFAWSRSLLSKDPERALSPKRASESRINFEPVRESETPASPAVAS